MEVRDLSIIIPARNEMFLGKTIENVLENIEGNTEIIVILDGAWPLEPIPDNERVTIVYVPESIGQRGATNLGVRISTAKFIMKLDAHCAVDKGFDVKLMKDCEYDWTVIPRMYNLHAFDWKCNQCNHTWYQGPTPTNCEKCSNSSDFERVIIWKPRLSRRSDFMRFDGDLHFQYWGDFENRPEGKGEICDTMSNLGACWMMHRQRYWDLDGLDENHGSWGQMGTEISCKTWLSGGRQVVNKKTWFSHMFRTQGGDFGFPYPLSGKDVDNARKYSKDIWKNNKWPKAKHDLDWLIKKFSPVPGWGNYYFESSKSNSRKGKRPTKGVVYYTDNLVDENIGRKCREQILEGIKEKHVVSVSLKPLNFGKNIVLPLERGYLTMAKQILAGLEASEAEVIFFCEHDVLYHPSHFDFIPEKKDVYYYNVNVWKLRVPDGLAVKVDDCRQLSGLCGYRKTLITHYKERIRRIEAEGFSRAMGFEPGTHNRKERIDTLSSKIYSSDLPNVDIRHSTNLTSNRWTPEQFRNKKYTLGWTESHEIPGWGITSELISSLALK